MNDFNKSKAQLVSELVVARAENAQLRALNADWAWQSRKDRLTILKLKGQVPAQAPNTAVISFADKCRAYCAKNNCRSVPADVVKSWRTQA